MCSVGKIKNTNCQQQLYAADGTQIVMYTYFGKQLKQYVSIALMIMANSHYLSLWVGFL